ncbi:MAG: SMP-30/gluconolactonase/LRE family protein [Pseudomonadota bacterium]|nr:SMP-30/gluconolactonase/LRE family protein [Pseudomonadota bacterium]
MAAAPDIACVLDARALNGESPVWDAPRRRLWWVDIREPALHEFDPATGADQSWELPAWVGYCAPADSGVLVALRTGISLLDPESGALRHIAPAPFDQRRFIFNDGRCDPRGRVLGGPMFVPLRPEPSGPVAHGTPLWRYDGEGRWTAMSEPVQTSNGLAWSPDGRTMYHSDTEQRCIWAYDYDLATGAAENRRVFARVDVSDGGPDGASVDRDGFYWVAVFANACLLRFDPSGKLERKIAMPVRYPTMPAFGGENLDTIFVTSAKWPLPREEWERHPLEGNLFALPAPVPGLPSSRWAEI